MEESWLTKRNRKLSKAKKVRPQKKPLRNWCAPLARCRRHRVGTLFPRPPSPRFVAPARYVPCRVVPCRVRHSRSALHRRMAKKQKTISVPEFLDACVTAFSMRSHATSCAPAGFLPSRTHTRGGTRGPRAAVHPPKSHPPSESVGQPFAGSLDATHTSPRKPEKPKRAGVQIRWVLDARHARRER